MSFYLLDCNLYEDRYGVITLTPLFILSGLGFYRITGMLENKIPKGELIKKKKIFFVSLLAITLVISLNSGLYLKHHENDYQHVPIFVDSMKEFSDDPIVLTSHRNEMFKFSFFSDFKNIYTIEDLIYREYSQSGESYIKNYYKNKTLAKNYFQLPFSEEKENFFVHGYSCLLDDYHDAACEKAMNEHEKEKITSFSDKTLYRIMI